MLAGRQDLCDIVLWHCRKYQRLSDLITLDILDLQCLNAMTRAFLGMTDEMASQQPSTIADWMVESARTLGKDRDLRQLLGRREEWMKGQPARDEYIMTRRRVIDEARGGVHSESPFSEEDRTGREYRRLKMMCVW